MVVRPSVRLSVCLSVCLKLHNAYETRVLLAHVVRHEGVVVMLHQIDTVSNLSSLSGLCAHKAHYKRHIFA